MVKIVIHLIIYLVNIHHNNIYLKKYLQDIWKILIKVKILLYLHMDKLVQEKHILCLVILKINKNLVLYQEHYKEYLIQIIIIIWYHVLCYKSIIKKWWIYLYFHNNNKIHTITHNLNSNKFMIKYSYKVLYRSKYKIKAKF
jgi:hypothetical protein